MIYFLVTASMYDNSPTRKQQYINGITKLKKIISEKNITNYKLIIIENNGKRNTFFDQLHDEIYYTNNNLIIINNKGKKEIIDIHDCIKHYNINDNDFIVKMTGRYLLNDNSEFINTVANLNNKDYDAIIKYGAYFAPVSYKTQDCITGLIGMKCFYIKQIEVPSGNECIEWNWAKITYLMNDEKICKVNKLGIYLYISKNPIGFSI